MINTPKAAAINPAQPCDSHHPRLGCGTDLSDQSLMKLRQRIDCQAPEGDWVTMATSQHYNRFRNFAGTLIRSTCKCDLYQQQRQKLSQLRFDNGHGNLIADSLL
jgi:hypothetical protein